MCLLVLFAVNGESDSDMCMMHFIFQCVDWFVGSFFFLLPINTFVKKLLALLWLGLSGVPKRRCRLPVPANEPFGMYLPWRPTLYVVSFNQEIMENKTFEAMISTALCV